LLLKCQTWWKRTPSTALELDGYPKRCARVYERSAWIEMAARARRGSRAHPGGLRKHAQPVKRAGTTEMTACEMLPERRIELGRHLDLIPRPDK
jgi:hypothetical protein